MPRGGKRRRQPAPEQAGTTGNPLPLLVLSPDHAAEWPLWLGAGGGMVDAQRLGLSRDLVRRVASWNEHFLHGYRYDREQGWETPGDERWHLEAGVDVFHRLSAEVQGRYRVEHLVWAVDP